MDLTHEKCLQNYFIGTFKFPKFSNIVESIAVFEATNSMSKVRYFLDFQVFAIRFLCIVNIFSVVVRKSALDFFKILTGLKEYEGINIIILTSTLFCHHSSA